MFTITAAPREANAWSKARLPFQPKEEMLEFRQQLAAASAMQPTPGAHLVATYTAADPTALIDMENVLFYNVGLACFSAHTRTGLAFGRVFRGPAAPPTAPAGRHATTTADNWRLRASSVLHFPDRCSVNSPHGGRHRSFIRASNLIDHSGSAWQKARSQRRQRFGIRRVGNVTAR